MWLRDYRRSMTKWQKGSVTKLLGTHTYLVTVETGLVVRQHADQMQSYGRIERKRLQKQTITGLLV